jgi:hypothetical protein
MNKYNLRTRKKKILSDFPANPNDSEIENYSTSESENGLTSSCQRGGQCGRMLVEWKEDLKDCCFIVLMFIWNLRNVIKTKNSCLTKCWWYLYPG